MHMHTYVYAYIQQAEVDLPHARLVPAGRVGELHVPRMRQESSEGRMQVGPLRSVQVVPGGSKAVESAGLEAASSSTRGSGWAPSGLASSPGSAELPRAAGRALRRRRSRAGAPPCPGGTLTMRRYASSCSRTESWPACS
jgi:hypothetical protein